MIASRLLAGCVAIGASAAPTPQVALSLEIRSGQQAFRAGDEIPITFTIRNGGTDVYEYIDRSYDRSGRMPEYRLQVHDEHGALVPDPRDTVPAAGGYIGGGLGSFAELRPGERFSKTIALNLWALVSGPGLYTVRGTYFDKDGRPVESAPLVIRVLERNEVDMERHIDALASELTGAQSPDVRVSLIKRLMFTRDRRAALALLQVPGHDNNAAFWIHEAFTYYLPKDGSLLYDALSSIRRHGLSPATVAVLEQLGTSSETIKDVIARALESANRSERSHAALAAQRYPDDRLMGGLVREATDGDSAARMPAIYAIAMNRTDQGVSTLRGLLNDPDARIRTAVRQAIESAYRRRPTDPGRRLRLEDFPEIARR